MYKKQIGTQLVSLSSVSVTYTAMPACSHYCHNKHYHILFTGLKKPKQNPKPCYFSTNLHEFSAFYLQQSPVLKRC